MAKDKSPDVQSVVGTGVGALDRTSSQEAQEIPNPLEKLGARQTNYGSETKLNPATALSNVRQCR